MSVKVDVSGLADFANVVGRMSEGFEDFLRKFLLKEALRVLASTKRLTPVDSGYLRNSWQVGDSRYNLKFIKSKRSYKPDMVLGKGKYRVISAKGIAPTINCVRKFEGYLIIEIYNPVEYASYVEYGHAQEPGRYVPAIGKRLKAGWVPGVHMCATSIENIAPKMPSHYEAEFRKWLRYFDTPYGKSRR